LDFESFGRLLSLKGVIHGTVVRNEIVIQEELNDLYSSPNNVRVIKPRRMRWAGHVARMGEESGVYRVLLGKPEGR